MNSCVLIADIIQAPQIRYTADNQTAIAEMVIQFPSFRDNDPPSRLKVVAWGNLAQTVQEQCHVGQQYALEGRLQINSVPRPEGFKDKVAELVLARFQALGASGSSMAGGIPAAAVPLTDPAPAYSSPAPATPAYTNPTPTYTNPPAYSNPAPAAPASAPPTTPTPIANPNYDDIPF